MDWHEFFWFSRPIPEILLRGTLTYVTLFVMMRVTGKRESGSHSLTDLLVVVLVAQASGNALTGSYSGFADGMLLVATILGWSVGIDALAYRFAWLRPILKPRASALIVDGKVNRRALLREFIDDDELMEELRLHGCDDINQVARAYLEPNGMVSVLLKDRQTSTTPREPSSL